MYIKRDKYLNDLIDRMHNGMIKVVTGIRRCGKSYLLFNILEYANQNMLLVNGGIVVVATLILLLSFLLSKSLYENREF